MNKKGLPEYSDEQLLEFLEQFENLPEEERAARRLGAGVDKIVYDVPGKGIVLKVPNTERPYTKYGLDTDYFYSKMMNKSIPVETPVLIKQPEGMGKSDVLFQRKLTPISDQSAPTSEFYDSLYDNYPNDKLARENALKLERERIKNLPGEKELTSYFKQFDNAGLNDADLHRANVALDVEGKTKAIDVAPFHYDRVPNHEQLNRALFNARDSFTDKMEKLAKTRIFRSVAGALPLAGTAMALSSGDASAAAAELPSELPVVGQAYDAIRSENAGSAQDDYDIQNEVKARQNYDSSAARQDALRKLTGR